MMNTRILCYALLTLLVTSTSCRKELWDEILMRGSGIWLIESRETIQIYYDGTSETEISDFDEAYWRFYLGPGNISTCEVYGSTDGEVAISLPVFTFDTDRLSLYDGNTYYTYTIEELNRNTMVLSRYEDVPSEGYSTKVHIVFSSCPKCEARVDYDGIEAGNI